MTIALRRLREDVRLNIRDTDARRQTYNVVELDQAIANRYLLVQGRLPAYEVYTASAFTISANADTFTLPTTVSQWTGNDGGAEYAGKFRIQLASTGQFLHKLSEDEMAAYRAGQITTSMSIPEYFSLYEDKTQTIQGRVYPGAQAAQACHLYASMQADDLRAFIGSGSDDLDDVELQMSREAEIAVLFHASADLLERMGDDDLALRRFSPRSADKTAAGWRREAELALYREASRRHSIEDNEGRTERRVS
jgi:hypothetical protein